MPSSYQPYPGYAPANASQIHYAHANAPVPVPAPPSYCPPPRPAYHRPYYPERYERSTAISPHDDGHFASDGEVLLSPTHSLPEPPSHRSPSPPRVAVRRTSSLDVSPARTSVPVISQPRPIHTPLPLPHSPPSLVGESPYSHTHSPPEHKITTPPYTNPHNRPNHQNGLSSLMQLAHAAEHDQIKSVQPRNKDKASEDYITVTHRLPGVSALLNPAPDMSPSQYSSRRTVCG